MKLLVGGGGFCGWFYMVYFFLFGYLWVFRDVGVGEGVLGLELEYF